MIDLSSTVRHQTTDLTDEEKHALSVTLKFRITDLLRIEAGQGSTAPIAREQIDLLVSAAEKLEIP